MTREKRDSWLAQGCAVVGVALWLGATMYFELYPIPIIVAVFGVPATIASIAPALFGPKST